MCTKEEFDEGVKFMQRHCNASDDVFELHAKLSAEMTLMREYVNSVHVVADIIREKGDKAMTNQAHIMAYHHAVDVMMEKARACVGHTKKWAAIDAILDDVVTEIHIDTAARSP